MIKRPALKWYGGKWRIAQWVADNLPEHTVYVEPYGGAASVLLKKHRCKVEVYNDIYGDVVNFFRVLRDSGYELAELIRNTPYSREEFNNSYSECEDNIEAARRFVVKSFMSFGSNGCFEKTGFRYQSLQGSLPAKEWTTLTDNFIEISARLRGVIIDNIDAIECMRRYDSEETLHYVDPPYVMESRSTSKDVYIKEMSYIDHESLYECLISLRGAVAVSGYRCDLYDDLYSDWTVLERTAYALGGRKRQECLWLSPNVKMGGLFLEPV